MKEMGTLPKETAIELLRFLADNEKFEAVERQLSGGISVAQTRACLRELAAHLAKGIPDGGFEHDTWENELLSVKAKDILSNLTPSEEKRLLDAFGFSLPIVSVK